MSWDRLWLTYCEKRGRWSCKNFLFLFQLMEHIGGNVELSLKHWARVLLQKCFILLSWWCFCYDQRQINLKGRFREACVAHYYNPEYLKSQARSIESSRLTWESYWNTVIVLINGNDLYLSSVLDTKPCMCHSLGLNHNVTINKFNIICISAYI